MIVSGINLDDLQNEMLGDAQNLILPENAEDKQRALKARSMRKIVEMYSSSRKRSMVYKATYDALKDSNPWTRIAAADLIGKFGNANSFEYLFQSLEDEIDQVVKQKIALSINKLETRLNNSSYGEEYASLIEAARVLSYEK